MTIQIASTFLRFRKWLRDFTTNQIVPALCSFPKWFWQRLELAIVLILLAWLFHLRTIGPPREPIDPHIAILSHADSSMTSPMILQAHNALVLTVLSEQHATGRSMMAGRESNQMQARILYFTILALIIPFIFRDKILQNTRAVSILACLVIMMYLLDVHLEDQLNRDRCVDATTGLAIDELTNQDHADHIWRCLDYDLLNLRTRAASYESTRWVRKAREAAYPNLPQILYFIVPGAIICIFAVCRQMKRVRWS